ncbi:MAG: DNA-formamidopyrimidine glycosylase [Bacilli bacterium]|jgi:formamidopyrimidine-DNA glycosylase
MPELPEVETIKNILHRVVVNKKISDITILNRNTIDGDVDAFRKALIGKTFLKVERQGKFLIFHLDDDVVILSHLRMEGKYFYHEKLTDHYDKHTCVVFTFTDNSALEYNDTRKFGIMKLSTLASYKKEAPIANLGPEPFEVDNIDELFNKLQRKRLPIKAVLLDQSFLSGLGNIYVDEVLYDTKIHPETPANAITKAQLTDLIKASVKVLNSAILSGGSTIRSYHPSQGIDGGFQTKLNAYGRENQPCPRCNHPLRKKFVIGRGTTFCPRCQRNPALPYVLGITGPIASGKSSILAYFKSHGYQTYSADQIVKDLYERDDVKKKIAKIFGEQVFDESGNINKIFIANTITVEYDKKRRLEKILHPLVEKVIAEIIKKTPSYEKLVFEVPLLFESKIDDYCDETIYVDVTSKVQKKRLSIRHLPTATLLALNSSFDALHNRQKATYVIDNSSSFEKLFNTLNRIFRQ